MRVVLIRPDVLDPGRASTWSWYGASQALQMLGLSYLEAAEAPAGAPLVIDPAREQFCLNCEPEGGLEDLPAADLLQVSHLALLGPAQPGAATLPVFGPVRTDPPRHAAQSVLVEAESRTPTSLFLSREQPPAEAVVRLQFNARVFATIGLYLSRFSWAGNTSFKRFVREVDDLWDRDLRQPFSRLAVVDHFLRALQSILGTLFAELDLPLGFAWQHPCLDGLVRQHGLLLSHDVDQLFPDPKYRHTLDQTGNNRFCLPQWRELETRLKVRSAYYFYSPRPGDKYWFEPHYSPSDPAVAREIALLREGGWEVSLHQMSDADPETVLGENTFFAEATGQPTTGTRSHYLKHSPDTLSYKAAAGLAYDSTWYAEQTESGFLCGTTLPYRPLDCRTGAPVGLWEFPFVIEDGIVFGVYGEGTARDVEAAAEDGRQALAQVLASNGYACLNWHNYTFSDMGHTGPADSWPPALELLVKHLRRSSAALWTPLPIELADWCTRRAQVVVEHEHDLLVVHNTGPADCPDFVLGLLYGVAGAMLPPGAVKVGRCDWQTTCCLPLPLAAGERREVALRR